MYTPTNGVYAASLTPLTSDLEPNISKLIDHVSWLLENGFTGQFKKLGLPDNFVEHGTRDQILSLLKLDSLGIINTIKSLVKHKKTLINE